MPWTLFNDMHSGGGTKEPYDLIFIEGNEAEARAIFVARFGHDPDDVACPCCGSNYSVTEHVSLAIATGWHRGCAALETPRDPDTGRYAPPDDEWWREHYYLEPGEHVEARRRGWEVSDGFRWYEQHTTLEDFAARNDVLIVSANDTPTSRAKGADHG
jgi:hypothetical protein